MENNTKKTESFKAGIFRTSWYLFLESFELLRKDREALLLSAIGSLVSFIFAVGMFVIYWFMDTSFRVGPAVLFQSISAYCLSVFLLVFILTFVQVVIMAKISSVIDGKNLSFHNALLYAVKRNDRIFGWAVLSAIAASFIIFFVGMGNSVVSSVAILFALAWFVVVFFVVPSIASEDGKLSHDFQNSFLTIKSVWGETLSLGVIFEIFLVSVGSIIMTGMIVLFGITGGAFPFLILVSPFAVPFMVFVGFFFLCVSAFTITMRAIFRIELYRYNKNGRGMQIPEQQTSFILDALKK